MSSIVIYTFKKEGHPYPEQPYNAAYWKAKGFDFICFVSHKRDEDDFHGVWYVEELPVSWKDEELNAVMPKLNPQSVLDGYDYSLWIDADLCVADDDFFKRAKSLQDRGVVYADQKDKEYDSVYAYAWNLYKNKKEPLGVILKTISFLLLKGVRPSTVFHDTSVIFRAHEDDAVLEFDRWWWECLLTKAGGHHDRLVHSFALMDTPSLKWESF